MMTGPGTDREPDRTAGPGAPAVVVVGSLNLDLVVPVPHHPRGGETVLGGDHARHPGGKGANQAVAAARLGTPTAMVGRVGDDDAGQTLLASLAASGVDASGVRVTAGAPSGVALVAVDGDGENAIVVSPGANARLGTGDVAAAAPLLQAARVTLLQLEVPTAAVAAAAEASGGVVVLNPAPAAPLPPGLLAEVDVLVPNRGELAALAGGEEPRTAAEAVALARRLDVPAVVVTLGADGAVVVERGAGTAARVPAPPVAAVDTTAAGDAFCGGLADGLVRGLPLVEAAAWAVRVAAIAVTRRGAQPSLPSRADVDRVAAVTVAVTP